MSAPPPANEAPPPSILAPPASNNTSSPPSTPATPSAPPPATSPPPPTTSPPPPSPATPAATLPVASPPPPSPATSAATPPPSPARSPPSPPSTTSTLPPPPPRRTRNEPTARSPPSRRSPPSPPSDSSEISTGAIIGIAAACVIILALVSLVFFCCCKKKKRRRDERVDHYPPPHAATYKDDSYGIWQNNAPPPAENAVAMMQKPTPSPPPFSNGSSGSASEAHPATHYSAASRGIPRFTYEELALATNGFSNANLLGQGGFGYVHKGVLSNGKEMAVKQLKSGSGQGEREFQAEIDIIGRVHHRHLVSLIGHCITGTRRLLVYEFVPNNTLEFHLHGKDRPTMDWPTRRKIAIGSAKGLAYLHEDCNPRIIHRDIKAANILLDFQFEAKVADFGLARITSDVNTHVSTRVMGTFGYLAPEYASSGKLTEKSDVFSFGVMLLELITGRRPVDPSYSYTDDSLVDWARPLLARALEDGDFTTLIDPRLQNDYDHNQMARMVACAAASVRHSARRRPRMSRILRALEGDMSLADLNEGIQPGHSAMYSSHESSDYDNSRYKEDMRKFRKMALGSQEYGSSEYSGGNTGTSEFGFLPSGSSSEYHQSTQEMESRRMAKDGKGFSG